MKKAIAKAAPLPAGRIDERLATIQQTLRDAARSGGHATPDLVAISKTVPADAIAPLIAAGQRLFGENRVQEAEAKWPELLAAHPDIRLHLVGQLQSNKAARAAKLFHAIDSVDRPSLVKALAKAWREDGRLPRLFVQVNIGDEPQKGGVAIGGLGELLQLATESGLTISGLMAVPPAGEEPSPYFALLAKLAHDHRLPGLSMGMSHDYDVAAGLGATEVRIGSALFGARPRPKAT